MLGPLQVIEFRGITLDSNLMQASLPLDKLNHIREVMRNVLGYLSFAMRVIIKGQSFISRLLDLSKSVKNCMMW